VGEAAKDGWSPWAPYLWRLRALDRIPRKCARPQNGESMARPRTPTAVLELRGAFKNHPSRLKDRKYEPIIKTLLPEPPKYRTTAATKAWNEMESWGFWLRSFDQFLVAIAATLMARYRIDELKSGDVSLSIGLLGKIGFSPKERVALNLPTRST